MGNKQKGHAISIIIYMMFFVVAIALCVGGYYVKRWWNYTFSYKDQVQETVCQMVEPKSIKLDFKTICGEYND